MKISLQLKAHFLNLNTWEKGNRLLTALQKNIINLEENKCFYIHKKSYLAYKENTLTSFLVK